MLGAWFDLQIKQLILAPIGVIVYSSDNATPSIPSKVT